MIARVRLLLGISVFWLALSMIFDGINTLVLPNRLITLSNTTNKATTLGLLTFIGLVIGMLVQPIAGIASDRLRPRLGRMGFMGFGVVLILAALILFGASQSLFTLLFSFTLIQVTANLAQAAQQGLIPDLVPIKWRGRAAGLKGFMDVGGALLGFVVLGQLLGSGQTTLALLTIAAVVIIAFALSLLLIREKREGTSSTVTRPSLLDAFRLNLREHHAFARLVTSRFLFLLGTYMVGRFFLFFVADRLGLEPGQAAKQAGALLAVLTFITVLGAPLAGWLADRFGRTALMIAGSVLSAAGVLWLIFAGGSLQILLSGGLMAFGSAAFASANWAGTADLAPPQEAARFLGLANLGTAGAAAAAGLFGPLVDWANGMAPGAGYSVLFVVSALAFTASAIVLRGMHLVAEQPMSAGLDRGL